MNLHGRGIAGHGIILLTVINITISSIILQDHQVVQEEGDVVAETEGDLPLEKKKMKIFL